MRSQKPANRAAAGGMHEGHDAAVNDQTIEAGVIELDQIPMVTLEAVHGGPLWQGDDACPDEVHCIQPPALRRHSVTRSQSPTPNSMFDTEKNVLGIPRGEAPCLAIQLRRATQRIASS